VRARKPSDPGSGGSSGRLGLAVLVATVAAFLLVGVAQAAAAAKLTVVLAGSGEGEVVSPGKAEPGSFFPGSPNMACHTPVPGEGTCTNSMDEVEPGIFVEGLYAKPAAGSVFVKWVPISVATEEGCGKNQECLVAKYSEGEGEIIAEFEKEAVATPNLKVVIEEGEGTVVSNPAGISCKPTCEGTFEVGKKVTLTASPAPGYLFKGWKSCTKTVEGTGVNGRQCTIVTTESLQTIGAKFYKAFSLEGKKSNPNGIFSTSPAGVNCGYGCTSSSALYKEGALTLKAKAAKHFHFVEFKGGTGSASSCNGVKALECTIATFNSNSSIEEVYAEDAKSTLTLSKTGGGQGLVKTNPTNVNCTYTCTAAKAEFYVTETAVPVSVTLGKGTEKVTWTTGAGTCTGNAVSCTVDMSSSKTLVANFE
jgi:hypothetical protein